MTNACYKGLNHVFGRLQPMKKPSIPEGASLLSPLVSASDLEKAITFYPRAFGFRLHRVVRDDADKAIHIEFFYHDQAIMVGPCEDLGEGMAQTPAQSGHVQPLRLYLYCKDVDAFYTNALKEGAISITAPEDMFWNDRMCRLKDPDGYIWAFAQHMA